MSAYQRISHKSKLLLLGSCFSDEIGKKLQENGFVTTVNPGGTIFHPLALSKLLFWALADQYRPLRIHQRDDVFLSWDLSGTFYAMSEQALNQKFEALYLDLRGALQKSSHLLLTFGSSWAYTLCADNDIVANCHKAPPSKFQKTLSQTGILSATWIKLLVQLRAFNPSLQIVFTLSPVRHLKEGLVGNNRSKARLILLLEELTELPNCTYFEAYELVLDQLRDYAYYKDDGAHPNQKATAAVWEAFKTQFLDESSLAILDEWQELQQRSAHRLLYPESQAAQQFQKAIAADELAFFKKYPDFRPPTLF